MLVVMMPWAEKKSPYRLDLRSPGITEPESESEDMLDDFDAYIPISVEVARCLLPRLIDF